MSNKKSLTRSASSKTAKTPSKIIRTAYVCMLLAFVVVTVKMANNFVWVISEVQHTIASEPKLPSQAEGAFYFIEPQSKTL